MRQLIPEGVVQHARVTRGIYSIQYSTVYIQYIQYRAYIEYTLSVHQLRQ